MSFTVKNNLYITNSSKSIELGRTYVCLTSGSNLNDGCRGNSSVGDIVPEGATHDVASRKSDLDDRNRSRSLHRAHQQRAMGADGHTYCNNEPWKAMSTPGQRAMGSVGSPIGGSCCREGRPPTRSLSIPSASATTPMPTAGGPLSLLCLSWKEQAATTRDVGATKSIHVH